MINFKEQEKNNQHFKRINFKNDFDRLLELIKDDEFFINLIDELDPVIKKINVNNEKFCGSVFWNRFDGTFKIDKALSEIVFMNNDPELDFLSWFPILKFDKSLFYQKKLCDLYKLDKTEITVELVFKNKELLAKFLKNKITSTLKSDYKKYLVANLSNNYDFFYSKWKNRIGYPIDVLSIEAQFYNFWQKTELFTFRDQSEGIPFNVIQDGYVIDNLLNSTGRTIKVKSILFDNYDDFCNFKFRYNYDLYLEELIDMALVEIEKSTTDSKVKGVLFKFLGQFQKQFPKKISESYCNDEDNFLMILDSDIKNLEKLLYDGTDLFSSSKLGSPYFNSSRISESWKKEQINKKILEFLEKNSSLPAEYFNELYYHDDLKEVYSMALEKKIPITETFYNLENFERRIKLFNNPIIYCPVKISDRGQIKLYSSLTNKHYFETENEGFKTIEEGLIRTNSKTTKLVKETIENLLKLPFNFLNDSEKNHLQFVLKMETID